MTAAVDDIDTAFEQALAADAGVAEPPEIPAPPRLPDADAPHGRAEDGTPNAPHGLKADGTPRLRPAGPGRPKADAPRVETSAPAAPAGNKRAATMDYSQDLTDLGMSVWIGASCLKGGRLFGLPLPDARPYAAVWHASLPQTVAAWNAAAKQNATVRGYVQKFTGDGAMTWVIGVAVASAGLAAACTELAKAPAEVKASAVAANDANMQKYIAAQVEAMGLEAAA